MGTVEFVLERTINAPIDQVFARLVDIEGYNDWMPAKGSIRRKTTLTSAGEPAVGTTFVDQTSQGELPGEILAMETPRSVTLHWWDKSKKGTLRSEGWPSHTLEAVGEGATLVRHHAKLTTYGPTVLMTPIFKVVARRERTTTIDALKAACESG